MVEDNGLRIRNLSIIEQQGKYFVVDGLYYKGLDDAIEDVFRIGGTLCEFEERMMFRYSGDFYIAPGNHFINELDEALAWLFM